MKEKMKLRTMTLIGLMAALVFEIKPSSCVLVKASHFMEFSKVVDNLKANLS